MKLIPVFFTFPVGVHFKLFFSKSIFFFILFSRRLGRINLSILPLVTMQPLNQLSGLGNHGPYKPLVRNTDPRYTLEGTGVIRGGFSEVKYNYLSRTFVFRLEFKSDYDILIILIGLTNELRIVFK